MKGGQLYRVGARAVVWAGASFTSRHAIRDLPEAYRDAMAAFPRSPILCVNVALDNWRFLYDLGFTACSWRGGFGFSANLRPNMYVGDYRPPLDPDQPNLFTFYVPFNQPGLPLAAQGPAARARLFGTTYRDFETQIRRQLATLFSGTGFDPSRDIAGIVLNRWGHAYCNPAPGFFTSRDGKPTPSDQLRRPLGRIAFAHSELNGNQHWANAAYEGRRAAQQALEILRPRLVNPEEDDVRPRLRGAALFSGKCRRNDCVSGIVKGHRASRVMPDPTVRAGCGNITAGSKAGKEDDDTPAVGGDLLVHLGSPADRTTLNGEGFGDVVLHFLELSGHGPKELDSAVGNRRKVAQIPPWPRMSEARLSLWLFSGSSGR